MFYARTVSNFKKAPRLNGYVKHIWIFNEFYVKKYSKCVTFILATYISKMNRNETVSKLYYNVDGGEVFAVEDSLVKEYLSELSVLHSDASNDSDSIMEINGNTYIRGSLFDASRKSSTQRDVIKSTNCYQIVTTFGKEMAIRIYFNGKVNTNADAIRVIELIDRIEDGEDLYDEDSDIKGKEERIKGDIKWSKARNDEYDRWIRDDYEAMLSETNTLSEYGFNVDSEKVGMR